MQLLSFVVSVAENSFGRILTTFSVPSPAGAGKVENPAQMTQFCTRNKPTLFVVQLLSLFQYGTKMVRSSFDNFSGLVITGPGKVQNRPYMTQFSGRNIPTLFVVQFLSFIVSTVEKRFSRVLTTFRIWAPPEQDKLKQYG